MAGVKYLQVTLGDSTVDYRDIGIHLYHCSPKGHGEAERTTGNRVSSKMKAAFRCIDYSRCVVENTIVRSACNI